MRVSFLSSIMLLSVFLFSCATRTKYQAYDGQTGGYFDGQYDNGVRWARFAGNAYTNRNDVQLFSLFRAIESCKSKGYKYSNIFGSRDLSVSKDIQRTSTNTYVEPTNFSMNGNSNSNINYLGNGNANISTNSNYSGSISGGNQYANSSSWTETLTFPVFEAGYQCVDGFYLLGFTLNPVNEVDLKPYVKDLKGALQIEKVADDSPNVDKFKVADIIIKVNDNRVWDINDLSKYVNASANKDRISLGIVRDGKKITILAKATDKSQSLIEYENKIKNSVCGIEEFKENYVCHIR